MLWKHVDGTHKQAHMFLIGLCATVYVELTLYEGKSAGERYSAKAANNENRATICKCFLYHKKLLVPLFLYLKYSTSKEPSGLTPFDVLHEQI